MSVEQGNIDARNFPGFCLMDLLKMEASSNWTCQKMDVEYSSSCPREKLGSLLYEPGNRFCADCGSPDPKWVSLSLGVFICIKCSGVHRSLGAHISKVFSVKLDEWTHEQVDALTIMGGNTVVNSKYEALLPEDYRRPNPDSSIEDRSDFIRRKYEMQQFLNHDAHMPGPLPLLPPLQSVSSIHCRSSSCGPDSGAEKKHYEKQTTSHRIHGLGHAFRHSWRRKEHEHRYSKKSNTMAGMVEFIGLIKVNVVKGTNLAVRDVMSSDPYVILSLGTQSVKTRVIKNNLNPVWNEKLMLSIPNTIPLLKLVVYDKDKFSTDDFMGEAEIDIQPLVSAARATENSSLDEPSSMLQPSKCQWKASQENIMVIREGNISQEDGKVKQQITLKLQNVERGILEIELECLPLTQ